MHQNFSFKRGYQPEEWFLVRAEEGRVGLFVVCVYVGGECIPFKYGWSKGGGGVQWVKRVSGFLKTPFNPKEWKKKYGQTWWRFCQSVHLRHREIMILLLDQRDHNNFPHTNKVKATNGGTQWYSYTMVQTLIIYTQNPGLLSFYLTLSPTTVPEMSTRTIQWTWQDPPDF